VNRGSYWGAACFGGENEFVEIILGGKAVK
jgi:hypothetical protein